MPRAMTGVRGPSTRRAETAVTRAGRRPRPPPDARPPSCPSSPSVARSTSWLTPPARPCRHPRRRWRSGRPPPGMAGDMGRSSQGEEGRGECGSSWPQSAGGVRRAVWHRITPWSGPLAAGVCPCVLSFAVFVGHLVLFAYGLYAVVSGKIGITPHRWVHGATARLAGLLLMSPLVLWRPLASGWGALLPLWRTEMRTTSGISISPPLGWASPWFAGSSCTCSAGQAAHCRATSHPPLMPRQGRVDEAAAMVPRSGPSPSPCRTPCTSGGPSRPPSRPSPRAATPACRPSATPPSWCP